MPDRPHKDKRVSKIPSILSGEEDNTPPVELNGNGEVIDYPETQEDDRKRNRVLPPILSNKPKPKTPRNGNGAHKNSDEDDALLMEEFNVVTELLDGGDPQDAFGLDSRTEVNELQILHFSRAEAMAEYYGIDILHAFVTNIKRLSISKNRKSRKEAVAAIQSMTYGHDEVRAGGLASLGKSLGR